jgi:hypothetical protein
MTEPVHELYDFAAFAAQLTNEQKILAALEQIVVLLTPKEDTPKQNDQAAAQRSAQIAALAAKSGTRRK